MLATDGLDLLDNGDRAAAEEVDALAPQPDQLACAKAGIGGGEREGPVTGVDLGGKGRYLMLGQEPHVLGLRPRRLDAAQRVATEQLLRPGIERDLAGARVDPQTLLDGRLRLRSWRSASFFVRKVRERPFPSVPTEPNLVANLAVAGPSLVDHLSPSSVWLRAMRSAAREPTTPRSSGITAAAANEALMRPAQRAA